MLNKSSFLFLNRAKNEAERGVGDLDDIIYYIILTFKLILLLRSRGTEKPEP